LERLARGTRSTNVLDTVKAAGAYDHIAGNISEALKSAEEGEVAIVGLQQTRTQRKKTSMHPRREVFLEERSRRVTCPSFE